MWHGVRLSTATEMVALVVFVFVLCTSVLWMCRPRVVSKYVCEHPSSQANGRPLGSWQRACSAVFARPHTSHDFGSFGVDGVLELRD